MSQVQRDLEQRFGKFDKQAEKAAERAARSAERAKRRAERAAGSWGFTVGRPRPRPQDFGAMAIRSRFVRRALRAGGIVIAVLAASALGLELGMRRLLFGQSALARRLGERLRRPALFAERWDDPGVRLYDFDTTVVVAHTPRFLLSMTPGQSGLLDVVLAGHSHGTGKCACRSSGRCTSTRTSRGRGPRVG